jgi:small-conductance mechanosensitive channel
MSFKYLLKDILEEAFSEWDNEETKKQLKERLFDPVIHYLMDKMYPYLIMSVTVVFLLISLLIMILFLIMRGKKI